MTIKEKIKVMQAFADGKEIECKNKVLANWDACISPVWDWRSYEYRIKSEPEYVPYTFNDAKGLIGKTIIHKKTKNLYMIIGASNAYVNPAGYGNVPYGDILANFTDINGSPLGKVVL